MSLGAAVALGSLLLVTVAGSQRRAAERTRQRSEQRAAMQRLRALEDRVIFRPEDAGAREALRLAYLERGEAEMAVALRERAGKSPGEAAVGAPPDLRALLGRAAGEPKNLALQREVVERSQEVDRLSAAVPALRRLAQAQPADAATWRRLGIGELQAGEERAARDHLRAAVARAPKDAVAHFYLGLAHAGRAEVPEALAAFARVEALQPDYAPAALERVRLLIEDWRLAEAKAEGRRLIRRRPKLADAHYHLGVTLYHLRDFPAAETALRAAAHLDPTRARYHGWLGLVLLEQNRPAEAITTLETAVAANPQYANALYQLGRTYLLQGRLNDAEPRLRRALLLDPRHAEAFYSFSQFLLRRGRQAEARQALARVRALSAFDQRRQELEQRARAEPHRPEWRRRLGDLYAREGLVREAEAQYARAKEAAE